MEPAQLDARIGAQERRFVVQRVLLRRDLLGRDTTASTSFDAEVRRASYKIIESMIRWRCRHLRAGGREGWKASWGGGQNFRHRDGATDRYGVRKDMIDLQLGHASPLNVSHTLACLFACVLPWLETLLQAIPNSLQQNSATIDRGKELSQTAANWFKKRGSQPCCWQLLYNVHSRRPRASTCAFRHA